MEAPRRRWIPIVFLLWLAIFVLAAELNSIRPNKGDPRWSQQWHAYYADGEAMFYAWVLPALGIVWTFALLLTVPTEERIGRRRMLWTWMKAGLGMSIVLGTLGTYISSFNATDVGSINAFLTWMSLAFFMAIVSVVIVIARRALPTLGPRTAGLIGSVAVIFIGVGYYKGDLREDPLQGLTGSQRAEAMVARLEYNAGDETMRHLLEQERTAGLGYKMFAAGDRVDIEVIVPWPEADAQRRERIAEFWNHPTPALDNIPRPPWHAEWRTSASDPPALVFTASQPADIWDEFALLMARSEAKWLAKSSWNDLRSVTTTLLDEHYIPSAATAGPQQSREILQVTLLRLAIQLDRLAKACSTAAARDLSGGPAAEVFRSTAARARELRAVLLKPDAPLPDRDLVSFADPVNQLGSSQWRMRPDGCEAVDSDEESMLSRTGDEIIKHATATK